MVVVACLGVSVEMIRKGQILDLFDCERSVKTTPRKDRAGIYWEEQVVVGGKIKSSVLHLSCLIWLLEHSVEILRR